MKLTEIAVFPLAPAVGLLGWTALASQSGDYRQLEMTDGTTVELRLTAPVGKADTYPFLLVLPPGSQGRREVDWSWQNVYADEAMRRGWVAVSPVAPAGRFFFEGSERYLPELLDQLFRRYPPEGGKVHLSGISNGGLAAFRIAVEQPELFHSVSVLPGWPGPSDLSRIQRLAGIPVKMWAGAGEVEIRLDLMRRAESALAAVASPVELEIREGEGHTLRSLRGGREVFDWLERQR